MPAATLRAAGPGTIGFSGLRADSDGNETSSRSVYAADAYDLGYQTKFGVVRKIAVGDVIDERIGDPTLGARRARLAHGLR